MKRFEELKNDIRQFGVNGKWIKATEHSKLFNTRHKNHLDKKGWIWFNEIIQKYRNGEIIIFKIRYRNWFVLPEYEQEFLQIYPDASRK